MAVFGRIVLLIMMFERHSFTSLEMPDPMYGTPPNPDNTTTHEYLGINMTEYLLTLLPSNLLDQLESKMMWEVINTYCPNVPNCSIATNNSHFVSGCCLNCECGDDCFVKGNCCHDKESDGEPIEGIHPKTFDGKSCITAYMPPVNTFYRVKQHHYLLKVTCIDLEDFENVYHCTQPNLEHLLDVTPVTSMESGISYGNKFCAACNNDDANLTNWKQTLECGDINNIPGNMLTPSFTEQDMFRAVYVHGQCSLTWSPPDDSDVEHCFPVELIYASCPQYTPAILNELCTGDNSPFIPYAGEMFHYRNMFCLACNLFENIEVLEKPLTPSMWCPAMPNENYVMSSDFIMHLNMNVLASLPTDPDWEDPHEGCDNGFIYNKELVC